MVAPTPGNMDECYPKNRCLFGENEGLVYDAAKPCPDGYTFNEDYCRCDPSEACDCNCHNECPECELCGADGKCYPDPACADPTGSKFEYEIAVLASEPFSACGDPNRCDPKGDVWANVGTISFCSLRPDGGVTHSGTVTHSRMMTNWSSKYGCDSDQFCTECELLVPAGNIQAAIDYCGAVQTSYQELYGWDLIYPNGSIYAGGSGPADATLTGGRTLEVWAVFSVPSSPGSSYFPEGGTVAVKIADGASGGSSCCYGPEMIQSLSVTAVDC